MAAATETRPISPADRRSDSELSLFSMGTKLLENRWRIARWMLAGGGVAAVVLAFKAAVYTASASFVPQGNESSRSGLASLAGQFGVVLPTSNQSTSPDFYVKLLKARVLLEPIVHDTFTVRELNGRRVAFLELFEIPDGTLARREELGIAKLKDIIGASVAKSTGVVEVTVQTPWPSVSLAIVTSLMDKVNEYNVRTRQTQALSERKFVEGRLAVAATELRAAEDRLAQFLAGNRQFGTSSELAFTRDRLQREVAFRQQIYTSLAQASEDVKIREVRDTPVITMFETPSVRTVPEPRGRLKGVALGLLVGAFIGALLALARGTVARRRDVGDAEADEFLSALSLAKSEMKTPVRWLRRRIGSGQRTDPRSSDVR